MKLKLITPMFAAAIAAALAFVASSSAFAADAPEKPAPTKEHIWLQQFVGEWESENEATMAPGQPPMKCKGTETVKSIGGIWIVAHGKSNMGGMDVEGVMTIGFDAEKKKFVGTWIDSFFSHLWKYEGNLDSTGNILTLESEGPNPMTGKTAKFRDVVEFKGKDEKILKSFMLGEDGKWTQFMTGHAKRRK